MPTEFPKKEIGKYLHTVLKFTYTNDITDKIIYPSQLKNLYPKYVCYSPSTQSANFAGQIYVKNDSQNYVIHRTHIIHIAGTEPYEMAGLDITGLFNIKGKDLYLLFATDNYSNTIYVHLYSDNKPDDITYILVT